MLVATPGQTTSFLQNNTKICHSSDPTSSTHNTQQNKILKLAEPSRTVSAATAFMKTLSVRLNRGNEYLKSAVQKALSSTASLDTPCKKYKNPTNNSLSTPTSKVAEASLKIKPETVSPTFLHRYPERSLSNDSTDSLYKEMCHFKPIRSAPTTPWKCGSKSRGAAFKVPKPLLANRTKLHYTNTTTSIVTSNSILSKPIALSPMEFSVPSAFVCLNAQIRSLLKTAGSQMKADIQHIHCAKNTPFRKQRLIKCDSKTQTKKTPPKTKNSYNEEKSTTSSLSSVNLRKRKLLDEKHCSSTVLKSVKLPKLGRGCNTTDRRGDKFGKLCSPPLTRSRLKQKSNQKLTSALSYNGRPI